MPFRISIVKTVALLILSVCSNNAVNLRGQADPNQAAPGQPNQAAPGQPNQAAPGPPNQAANGQDQAANGQANPSSNQNATETAAGSYLKNAAKSLGADQALAALGEHVSLQKRIVVRDDFV